MMRTGEKEEVLSKYNVPLNRLRNLGLDAKLVLPEHCPICGFGLENCSAGWEAEWSIHDRQAEIKKQMILSDELKAELDKLDAELDHLKKTTESRKFQLEIKYPDHSTPVLAVLDREKDLEMMVFFLQGKDRFKWYNDGDVAMKKEIDKLKKLFGIEE